MTIRTSVRSLAVSLIAVGLTACGEKVDCNSSTVKKNALEIIQSHLDLDPVYNQIKPAMSDEPKLENIKTIDTDKDRKQAQCSGSYSITYNEKRRSVDVAYDLAYLEDKDDTEVMVGVKDIQFWLFKLKLNEPPIKNGEEKVYDGSGRLKQILCWKNNRQDSTQEFYNPENGALVSKINMATGKKEGTEKHWSSDGQHLIAEVNWLNGKKEGSEKRWTSDGTQLMVDLNWVEGKKNGTEKSIREKDGKLMTDVVWKDGKATGFISSDEISLIPPHGPGAYTTTQFKDGLKNGPQKTYDGARGEEYLQKVENFKDDKLDGLVQHFNGDGELESEALYSEGNFVRKNETEAEKRRTCITGWRTNFRREGGVFYGGWDHDLERKWESWCKEGRLPPA